MPEGYTFVPEPNAVASVVLTKSTWAVLAMTCHRLACWRTIGSIDTDANASVEPTCSSTTGKRNRNTQSSMSSVAARAH
jgi:hypothetical protein